MAVIEREDVVSIIHSMRKSLATDSVYTLIAYNPAAPTAFSRLQFGGEK